MSTAPPPPIRTVEVSWGPPPAPPLSSWAVGEDRRTKPLAPGGLHRPGGSRVTGTSGASPSPHLGPPGTWKTPTPPAPSTEGWVPGARPTSQLPRSHPVFQKQASQAGARGPVYTQTHTSARRPFSCQAPRHSGHPSPSSCDTSHPRPHGPYCLHLGGHITPSPLHYLSGTHPLQSCSAHCPPSQASPWDSAGRTRVKKEVGVLNSTPVFTMDHATSNHPSLKGRVTICWG